MESNPIINENDDTFFQNNNSELEGIVQNEPLKNKYETVRYHKMNQFPYYLIGKVVSKFEIDGVNKFLNGVGILIGPRVVLTVAHNLCHLTQTGNIIYTKRVVFFPAANGDFILFDSVKSIKTYTPESYTNALIKDDKESQLQNDWGLIYLSTPIGNSITSLLDIDSRGELHVDNELYYFFTNNEHMKLDSLTTQTNSEKISIVGYTEYKDKYKNNTAYKFLGNFRKKANNNNIEKCETGTNEKGISKSIKKFLSEIVNEADKEKKININIDIIKEDVTEGLITSSRYYCPSHMIGDNNPQISLNGVDYIILGEEDSNKDFDVTDADKQIMSESKGKLVLKDEEKEKNMIKYQISTYKGQSGSPIFLRFKRISQSKKGEYVYHFIGLHSRRGPSVGNKNFYESEKMTALTENLLTNDVRATRSYVYKNELKFAHKTEHQDDIANDDMIVNISNTNNTNSNINEVKEQKPLNEIIAINSACDYNLAVSIFGNTIPTIINLINEHLNNLKDEEGNLPYTNTSTEFVYTKLLLNDKVRFTGLLKKHVPLSVLFSYGAQIFKVPKEYILLRDIANPLGILMQNYNFDHNKKLSQVMEYPDNCTAMTFELDLNIKKYGEVMAENILQKYLENSDLEENQLKKDFKLHMKPLFHLIFREINAFENIPLTYGKLFKKIRKMILTKIGLNEQAKN